MKQDRNSRIYDFQGERLTIAEIARRLGMRPTTLYGRLERMEFEKAISTPVRGRKS